MKWTERDEYTKEQIVNAVKTWANYPGFSAETCGQCKRKANVLAGSPGWFCDNGHYNVQALSGFDIPHEKPDLGPTRATIYAAHEEAREQDAPPDDAAEGGAR